MVAELEAILEERVVEHPPTPEHEAGIMQFTRMYELYATSIKAKETARNITGISFDDLGNLIMRYERAASSRTQQYTLHLKQGKGKKRFLQEKRTTGMTEEQNELRLSQNRDRSVSQRDVYNAIRAYTDTRGLERLDANEVQEMYLHFKHLERLTDAGKQETDDGRPEPISFAAYRHRHEPAAHHTPVKLPKQATLPRTPAKEMPDPVRPEPLDFGMGASPLSYNQPFSEKLRAFYRPLTSLFSRQAREEQEQYQYIDNVPAPVPVQHQMDTAQISQYQPVRREHIPAMPDPVSSKQTGFFSSLYSRLRLVSLFTFK